MRKRFVFIINPIAGNGSGKKIKEQIGFRYSHNKDITIETHLTQHPQHASRIAKDALKESPDAIVAVGGDGTMHEIASSLIGTKVPLGIIPVGSGNGLARHLGIPSDFHRAITVIERFRLKKTDAGKINSRYFFCTTGVGFDARIGNLFAENTKRGFRSYLKIVLKEVLKYKPKKYKLYIDGVKIKERAFMITFANASQYGNNAYIAPLANIRDGLIDISLLKPFPLLRSIGLAMRLFNKSIHQSRYTKIYQAKKITLKRKKAGEVHIDGEPVMMGKKLSIEVIPKALHVIVP